MLLGCIGDDFTGSSDLANTLTKQGMRTTQYTGVPIGDAATNVEAGVIALKSRSNAVDDAVRQSLAALAWLQKQGCRQFFFKYCSTFDSTPDGNIGPVADALINALDADRVIVCPAFPGTGRSVYQGHLFVEDVLLNESGMQNHPLTPMIDADIRRWLGRQSSLGVGHVAAQDVFKGSQTIKIRLDEEHRLGHSLIVVDAIRDEDLMAIGAAADDLLLITGGSGIAMGLPANFRAQGLLADTSISWAGEAGPCVALSGSCSRTTRKQVEIHAKENPAFEIVAADILSNKISADYLVDWAMQQSGIPLVYSSADPETVAVVQKLFGRDTAARSLEEFFAEVSRQLVAAGVKRLLIAGGETSGAVVEGLNLDLLEIGPEIDPGIPALRVGPELVMALKSGNFGTDDYFAKAAKILAGAG